MSFTNYLEDENDKPYFTTNSLAYYYDKMEGFAKAVEGAAKALNLTKEEIEQRIALRLAEWDKNLESFDGSVEKLLTEWVDDGTLTHVIDSALIDQKIAPVAAQLADIAVNITNFKNNENDWNDAFELAYHSLSNAGGKILIPVPIEINRSINLREIGTKIILIEGNTNTQNLNNKFQSNIIKGGNFDGVILNGGSSMKDIVVTRKSGVVDTSDGIWVAGLGCNLDNVYAVGHGGDGIRVGSKLNNPYYNSNISRLTKCGSLGNSGWGIHYSDDIQPTLPNANAGVVFAPDCRDNQKGGILFENCIDSQIYSPDCESNRGIAGIKIGINADAITVYSPYTENICEYEILLDVGSKNSTVWGYRGNTFNDAVTNRGIGNLIYGRHGTKIQYPFYKGRVAFSNLMVSSPDNAKLGSFHFEQPLTGTLDLISENIDIDTNFNFKHRVDGKKVTVRASQFNAPELRVREQDLLNTLRVRTGNSLSITISANGFERVQLDVSGVKMGDLINVSPKILLPSGVTYQAYPRYDNTVDIHLVNHNSTPQTITPTTWNILVLNGIQLT